MTKEKKYNLIIAVLSGIFFFIYSYLAWSVWWPEWSGFGQVIFNWPDANANFYFAKVFSEQGTLAVFEPLNQITDNLLHSRSINVFAGNLVPISFLPSIVLFGLVTKIFGLGGLLFLTPMLASLSVYMLYRLIYYIFSDIDLALIAALLFLPLGPWLYFANIVMLPTIMFIFLSVAGFLSLAIYIRNKKWFWWLLFAFLISLAIVVRPTEIVWLGLITIIVVYKNKNNLDYKKILSAVLVFVFLALAALFLNKATYGGYFSTGYLNLQSGTQATEFSSGTNYLKLLVAPFGFDIKQIFYNFGKYFVKLNWLVFALSVFGFILVVIKRMKEKKDSIWCSYNSINFSIFILIIIYYASWNLADPLVKNLNNISISYVRYFMPLYIMILPLAAYAIKFLAKKNKWLYVAFILLTTVFSFRLAFYSANDGLLATKENLQTYRQYYLRVHKIVEDDAIIISDRSEKIFFTTYRVIAPQGDLPFWPRLNKIIDKEDVYYFSNISEQQMSSLRSEANSNGMEIMEPVEIENEFKLYKIIRLNR